jgi:predicted RNA-binding protein (virulence factor B family)
MVEIGKFNRLRIAKERSVGYFFDGGEAGDILMPKRHQPDHCEVDDELDVFIFLDAEERLTATVRKPYAQVDEIAWLKVIDTHRVGAFLDWGLTKDLMVPLREQKELMMPGQYYLVKILLDDSNRIIGSTRIEDYLNETNEGEFEYGQEVDLILADETELGFKAIVNHTHWGLLYENEVFQKLEKGQKHIGYIKKLRDDLKIDLSLKKPGYDRAHMGQLGEQILERIEQSGGFLALSDKSPPEAIYEAFGISKKSYKQAVGNLYKHRLITLEEGGLRLAPQAAPPAVKPYEAKPYQAKPYEAKPYQAKPYQPKPYQAKPGFKAPRRPE